MNYNTDSEDEWLKIEESFKTVKKTVKLKSDYDKGNLKLTPLEKKIHEAKSTYDKLNLKYSDEYGSNDGSYECEELLDQLKALETCFRVLGIDIRTFQTYL